MNTGSNEVRSARGIWRAILWGTLGLLLISPALAMRWWAEVDWSAGDFVAMGGLLGLFGLSIEGAMHLRRGLPGRIVASVGCALIFLAVWAELAVGVFGTPLAGS